MSKFCLNISKFCLNFSSNRLWAYTGENFISPSASKIYPRRNTTTTCKGSTHGLTYKQIYIQKYNKKIYISKF